MAAYAGTELELFQHARNWKAYYGSFIRPFLGGEVLEVGAGIGATTESLCDGSQRRWLCLEPDAALARRIEEMTIAGRLPRCCEVKVGTTAAFPPGPLFDCILYIDVLEHIEDDRGELARAAALLRENRFLIVLAPAHQALYTPFDRAIGHYRRYNRCELASVMPPALERVASYDLDSAGLFLSLGNRLLLRRSMPTLGQIELWDRRFVPMSRRLDPLLRYRVGKSILEVRRKRST